MTTNNKNFNSIPNIMAQTMESAINAYKDSDHYKALERERERDLEDILKNFDESQKNFDEYRKKFDELHTRVFGRNTNTISEIKKEAESAIEQVKSGKCEEHVNFPEGNVKNEKLTSDDIYKMYKDKPIEPIKSVEPPMYKVIIILDDDTMYTHHNVVVRPQMDNKFQFLEIKFKDSTAYVAKKRISSIHIYDESTTIDENTWYTKVLDI